jgi:hypothetical protein
VDTDNQSHQSDPQAAKYGVLRAYASIIAVQVVLIALLWALHAPWAVLYGFIALACIAALFGKQLTGPTEHVQISLPAFECRIQNRYCSESNQLSNLGFAPLFFYGEAFPLVRLLLIYPAFLFLIMWLNREVVTVLDGSKLLFGYPVFISSDKSAYAHPMQLGMKYFTGFQDGTILLTKNFGGKTTYGPTVVAQILNKASIRDTWSEHQRRVQALEASGKHIDSEICFQSFSDMSRCA